MQIELAWGRCRRAWLRRCRPGYVRRMAEKRQGSCPGCPHDIVDPRDLKFCRNVCGYWFRPEDDRFRWRDRLGLARVGLAELVLSTLLFVVLGAAFGTAGALLHPTAWLPLPVLVLLWLEVLFFFRDPARWTSRTFPVGGPSASAFFCRSSMSTSTVSHAADGS
jgi:phosphatidylserine decarboxylase